MKNTFYILIFIFFTGQAFAQHSFSGHVEDKEGTVEMATVMLKGDQKYTAFTDEDGNFTVEDMKPGEYELLVYELSHKPVKKQLSIPHEPISIMMNQSQQELSEVVVTGTMKRSFIKKSPVKVEVLMPSFLRATPTNNIMEAVENVNGVQQQIACGVCGTNDIHINGMEGPYTLVLIDGMPIVSSLASVYGFNGIPSNLIKQVEIVKGPASSLYGSEAVGGVINIITTDQEDAPKFSYNTFVTSHKEVNNDVSLKFKVGKKASSIISANHYYNNYRMDFNDDNFTDIPLNHRFSIFNKWSFDRKDNKMSNLAIRYYTENRFGGEMNWQPRHRGGTEVYGESIYTDRIEVIGKYQLPTKENFRIDYSYSDHAQNSYYGNTLYDAQQSIFFSNFIWDKALEKHSLLLGMTNRLQYYNDNTPATPDAEQLYIPGLFVQDEMEVGEGRTILIGGRVDHHKNYGLVPSPRVAIKQKVGNWTTFRLNSGRGFRLVNLFTEDHAALTGSRTVLVTENLRPEQSYNVNLNMNHVYVIGQAMGTLDVDLFYTYFSNKIIPDYESDPNLIVYDNLDGHAIVRGASLSINHELKKGLNAKVGATFQDVYEIDDENIERKIPQVFTPKLTGTFVINYKNTKHHFWIDYTGKVIGPQNLPTFDEPFSRPEISPWYTLQNIQLTKSFSAGKFELYGGIKNIFNYTQPSPLIAAEAPFGDSFDTSYAYGPLQVRRYFLGFRYTLK